MDLTIHNARLDTTLEPVEIGITADRITKVQKEPLQRGTKSIDAIGAIVSPPFVEPHFHIENSLLWKDDAIKDGTLDEAIHNANDIKTELTIEDIFKRGSDTLVEAVKNGTQALRSHVDVDQVAGLILFDGVAAVRDRFAEVIDIQIIAFPQHGLTENPETVDLIHGACEQGADAVGGVPHRERDMDAAARHIEIAFEIARKYNIDIDMHVDETDDPYWHTLELLAEKTIEEGYQGRVVAGHCCAMAAWDDPMTERILEKVAKAQINIVTNTPVNLHLMGRKDSWPVRRGIPRVVQMMEAGINVSAGQDDLKNLFYPWGRMDMLEVTNFVCHVAQLKSPDQIRKAFDFTRYNAAKNMHLEGYGVYEGAKANLVLIDAETPHDAIRTQAPRPYIIRNGKIAIKSERSVSFSPQYQELFLS